MGFIAAPLCGMSPMSARVMAAVWRMRSKARALSTDRLR
jgi:hypothetical protein